MTRYDDWDLFGLLFYSVLLVVLVVAPLLIPRKPRTDVLPAADRSATTEGTQRWSDAYVEHWAQRYLDNGLSIRGVTLMQFLANPRRYDNGDQSLDPLPLLGAQRRVQRRLLMAELGIEHLPQRNGVPFEALKHHRHPRTAAAHFVRRARA